MKAFSRRRPCFRTLLIVGSIFLALWGYALATDTMIILPSRSKPGRVIKKSEQPSEFGRSMRFFGVVAAACVFVSLVRVNPIEDRLAAWRTAIGAKAHASGATTAPAPWWAYVFLAGFVAFIVYLGHIFMYRE